MLGRRSASRSFIHPTNTSVCDCWFHFRYLDLSILIDTLKCWQATVLCWSEQSIMSRFYLNFLRLVAFLHVVAIAAGQRRQVQQPTNICQQAASRLPGRISYPADSVYQSSRGSYYSEFERALAPGCIFRPTNAVEVSQFIKLVTADGQYSNASRSHNRSPKFAVRGGGHTLFSGAANIDGGVTIDLREIKSLALSQDRKVASIGGGAVWSDIYPQLVPYNLTVMGGRVPGVGVGGFATGGEYLLLNVVV